jgi:hypothetical protein
VKQKDDVVVLGRGSALVIYEAIRRARNHAVSTCPYTCRPELDAVLDLLKAAGV